MMNVIVRVTTIALTFFGDQEGCEGQVTNNLYNLVEHDMN